MLIVFATDNFKITFVDEIRCIQSNDDTNNRNSLFLRIAFRNQKMFFTESSILSRKSLTLIKIIAF